MHNSHATTLSDINWLTYSLPASMRLAPAANDSRSIDGVLNAIEGLLIDQHLAHQASPTKNRDHAQIHGKLDAAMVQALLAD